LKKTSALPRTAPRKIEPNLYQIPLLPPIAGFHFFFSAWLHIGSPRFLLDPGPSVTIHQVADILEDLGVTHLDYILLTHIHLDHAGGVSELASRFRKTPVICHPGAIPHLVDPARLWEGTLKTLGDIGKAYGPIQPLSPERITGAETTLPSIAIASCFPMWSRVAFAKVAVADLESFTWTEGIPEPSFPASSTQARRTSSSTRTGNRSASKGSPPSARGRRQRAAPSRASR